MSFPVGESSGDQEWSAAQTVLWKADMSDLERNATQAWVCEVFPLDSQACKADVPSHLETTRSGEAMIATSAIL